MASTSISAFSIYSQSQSPFVNSKSSRYALPNSLHRHYKYLPISFQPPTVRTTLLPTLTCSHAPSTPTPTFTSRRILSKFVSEKIASFLIGSFIFVGCFGSRAAIAVTPPSVVSGGVLDEEKMEGKSEEEREEMCEKILEKDPKNVVALKVILYGKIRRGKANEAIKFAESLINVEPNEVEWRLLLALCYETMGHFTTAKRLFKEILQKRPLLVRALHVMFLILCPLFFPF